MDTPPSNPQEIQQFLSSVLSQPGTNSVPYQEPAKWLITQHLLNLISSYPFLTLKTAMVMHNDGRSVNLLQADGTIVMLCQGVTYNIPVIIWLLESYPLHPPCVYVNPTPDMIIKQPHAHVTPSGLVSLPYLQNWVYPSSNLVDLVPELSAVFACDPPLYFACDPSPYQHDQQQSDDVAEVYKKAEAEEMLSLQEVLRRRDQEEIERLKQQLQVISTKTDVLVSRSRVRENQVKTKSLVDLNVYEYVDALPNQMLEATSLDLPFGDAVYSLDNSFQHVAVPFNQYSRNVPFDPFWRNMRRFSREQLTFYRFMG